MGEGIDRAVGGGRYTVGSWIHGRIDQWMEGGWVDGGGCVVIE